MKTNLVIVKAAFLCYACVGVGFASARGGNTAGEGKMMDTVVCKSDPSQSYALYIPAVGNKNALPVVYFFDSHAAGALPLRKYRSLADTYGFILIGSNNSKNGNDWAATENIWRHLSDDTRSRLKINLNRIYTCGFSGGAKVAGYIALKYPGVKGVIANGAGLPDETAPADFPFSFTAIAGEGDMNLTDLVAFNAGLDNTRTRHRLIRFDGKHEWAPESTMNMAFAGLQFDAMRTALIPKDNTFISQYIAKSNARLEAYSQSGQWIKAGQECGLSINFLDGLTDEVSRFKRNAASLATNPLYRRQLQAQDALLVTEQNTKAGYAQHFQQDDPGYWMKTIKDLQAKAGVRSTESQMYQRLLAYLSLVFYSFSNHLINSNENIEATHFVDLYKMVDPTNSEAWYFSAILHARSGQAQATENDLLRAAVTGFKDKDRMLRQPEFKNLPHPINFSRIEGRMGSK